jgi:hypothetical protein
MAFAIFTKIRLAFGDELIFRVSQLCCLGGEGGEFEDAVFGGAFEVVRHRYRGRMAGI